MNERNEIKTGCDVIAGVASLSPDVTSRPIPKIIVTATPSCTEDDIRKQREARTASDEQLQEAGKKNKNKSKKKKSRDRKNSSKQDSSAKDGDVASPSAGGPATPSAAGDAADSSTKKEKRKSSFLGWFDGSDGAGGDRRLSAQIAARFAKLHIISQL